MRENDDQDVTVSKAICKEDTKLAEVLRKRAKTHYWPYAATLRLRALSPFFPMHDTSRHVLMPFLLRSHGIHWVSACLGYFEDEEGWWRAASIVPFNADNDPVFGVDHHLPRYVLELLDLRVDGTWVGRWTRKDAAGQDEIEFLYYRERVHRPQELP